METMKTFALNNARNLKHNQFPGIIFFFFQNINQSKNLVAQNHENTLDNQNFNLI